jgi:hypothetical protein
LQTNARLPCNTPIFGGGIAGRTEHPHQVPGRPAERRAEFSKPIVALMQERSIKRNF